MAELLGRRELDFLLYELLDTTALLARPRYREHSREVFDAAIDLFARIAAAQFAPYYRKGDVEEPHFDGERVHLIPETQVAWDTLRASGFLKAHCDEAEGGLQLPEIVLRAAMAHLMVANGPATAYPFLTLGVINLLRAFGSETQKARYLGPLMDGECAGTMALTEPDQGSALGDIRTRAEPQPDGSYRLFGQKMFISGGEHELSANIVHMVLARIAGAPAGARGISLFLVPKWLPSDGGGDGDANIDVEAAGPPAAPAARRNDVALAGLLHKMGQRNSVTTVLNFGEVGGAVGYLVGAAGQGLACMFQMMNEARIGVGLNAAATALRGYRYALDYARSRKQGRPASHKQPLSPQVALTAHADVRRMLLAQKAYAEGGLALCLYASALFEDERTHPEAAARQRAAELLDLLTPVVKSWPAKYGFAANDLAIQVLGGAGYTREHPVEQLLRDQRINAIHEGTEGIHGLDLLGRKLRQHGGAGFGHLRAEVAATVAAARAEAVLAPLAAALETHWRLFDDTSTALLAAQAADIDRALANATAYLDVFGRVVMGWLWLRQACIAVRRLADLGESVDGGTTSEEAGAREGASEAHFYRGKLQAARWYLAWELPAIVPLCRLLGDGDTVAYEMRDAWF